MQQQNVLKPLFHMNDVYRKHKHQVEIHFYNSSSVPSSVYVFFIKTGYSIRKCKVHFLKRRQSSVSLRDLFRLEIAGQDIWLALAQLFSSEWGGGGSSQRKDYPAFIFFCRGYRHPYLKLKINMEKVTVQYFEIYFLDGTLEPIAKCSHA